MSLRDTMIHTQRLKDILADGGQSALESNQDKDMPHALDTEGDQGEDTPEGICRDKEILGLDDRQKGSRGDLEDGIGDDEDGVDVVEIPALEIQCFSHAADVRRVVTGPVHAEQEPHHREIHQYRPVEFHHQCPFNRGGSPYRSAHQSWQ